MGVLDFFKRTGRAITSENLEAKIAEVGASIAQKESAMAKLRAELPEQVLNGDNLAAHRIEHEEREAEALQIAKAELEAKLVDVRESEAVAEEEAACDVADEKRRKVEEAARACGVAIDAVIPAVKALIRECDDFRSLLDDRLARGWHLDRPIAESILDLIAAELYFRADGAVQPTARISELLRHRERGNLEEYIARLSGCVEAMRSRIRREREESRPGSADAAA